MAVCIALLILAPAGSVGTATGQAGDLRGARIKGQPIEDLLSSGGFAAVYGSDLSFDTDQTRGEVMRGLRDAGRGGNTYVNDPCSDQSPANPVLTRRRRVVQSETEIAVLNTSGSMGKRMVAGFNDSYGFYDNRQGLSGFAYSLDGGSNWVDGGGLPPKVPAVGTGNPPTTFPAGADRYFGDPVVVAHHKTQTFYYSSIYLSTNGYFTIGVNRGRFVQAAAGTPESQSNTRCLNDPSQFEVPDPATNKERVVWDAPVEAVIPPYVVSGDLLDKEWLYVDQRTGTLYLTYTRFTATGETPIEMVRCVACAFKTGPLTAADWTTPSVIVPNELFDFNQATQPITTPTGRVIVTWIMRRFSTVAPFPEIENRIEYAYSDDDGVTWTSERLIAIVNPQREPNGYNRLRATILNAPYIAVDKGEDDGVDTAPETRRNEFGNVYVTYFSGKTPLPLTGVIKAADIFVSRSANDGVSFDAPVKVNDDATNTTHLFPTVQANKNGSVFVDWIDRRNDPVDNRLNETWANVSHDGGLSYGPDRLVSDVATTWFVRADARPNMGDYNSSDLLGFNSFVVIWADGRFPPPINRTCAATTAVPCPVGTPQPNATPDVIFGIANGLGEGP